MYSCACIFSSFMLLHTAGLCSVGGLYSIVHTFGLLLGLWVVSTFGFLLRYLEHSPTPTLELWSLAPKNWSLGQRLCECKCYIARLFLNRLVFWTTYILTSFTWGPHCSSLLYTFGIMGLLSFSQSGEGTELCNRDLHFPDYEWEWASFRVYRPVG